MKRSKLALLPLGLALLLAACASDPLPIPQHSFGVYATASTPSAAFRTWPTRRARPCWWR